MKKAATLGMVLLLALNVGCSQEKEAKGKEQTKTEASSSKNAEKSALLDFEVNLGAKLRDYQAPFNAYTAALDPEKKTPKSEIRKLKEAAKTAGQKAAKEIPDLDVPSSLPKEDQQTFKMAFKDLGASYQTRADGLGDEKKTAQSDEEFQKFQDQVNKIHKKLGLIDANFANELQ
ncbi:hypothetical protein QUF79_13685 [Fictibacillus enclensis]|uniref:hypothetical protein n=1 Tax=Fictibacillus enclensis TaxID=1017270 RepID=UPI0025A2A33A|nr:hypothetical protein [Fictibacillus enclensis]MDM5199069.1 hypothetical protein [Fictibacillus enclensis]